MLLFRESVRVSTIWPPMASLLTAISSISCAVGVDARITRWEDDDDEPPSLHNYGLAVDVEVQQHCSGGALRFFNTLVAVAPAGYTVRMEGVHVHIQCSPALAVEGDTWPGMPTAQVPDQH